MSTIFLEPAIFSNLVITRAESRYLWFCLTNSRTLQFIPDSSNSRFLVLIFFSFGSSWEVQDIWIQSTVTVPKQV